MQRKLEESAMIRSRLFFDYSSGTWPISVATAKGYLRVTYSDDDTLIQTLIDEMCEYGQKAANVQITTAMSGKIVAVQSSEPSLASNKIELPYPNSAITVNSVLVNGTAITSSDYVLGADNILRLNSEPAATVIVVVEYSATIAETVNINTPILKLIGDAYENRTEQSIESLSDVKANARKYFQSYINGADLF